ncbi:hypothetical protein TorRG33x02_226770 [Trema orientale]|uniref:Uncharacterized protein n=1 Tax=Trema orientale TaxID=63057 RepID=A0A2P5E7M7_TREOI|nr:hypothetical protein TorRG33x02_226770 [Trema orientale]
MALLYSCHSSISAPAYLWLSLFSPIVVALSTRLRNPVYECIGAIALLQRKMVELQGDLAIPRAHLARFAASSSSSSSSFYSTILDRLVLD